MDLPKPNAAAAALQPYLAGLTPSQRSVVDHRGGPLLVNAGPGSGKTTVVTHRIASLIAEGVAPWRILGLTFTNKAAQEMRGRVEALLEHAGLTVDGVLLCTFHSFGARLMRTLPDDFGVPARFVILDAADQKSAIKQAIRAANLDPKSFTPASIGSAISAAKNQLKDAEAYESEAVDFLTRAVAKTYHEYEARLKTQEAVDFDDLLMRPAMALRDQPALRARLTQRWTHLLIDEYQDTNFAQFLVADLLVSEARNVTVVGDPDQSIYGWRGANIGNILEFETRYPDAKVIPLGENFRSTKTIVSAADALIRHNEQRKPKDLVAANDVGNRVRVRRLEDERAEAQDVVDRLKEMERSGTAWSEMAVLYRMNALSRVFEEVLRREGVPYIVAKGTSFFERKEVRDAVGYLRLLANPRDEVALERVVNMPPRGIGSTSWSRVVGEARACNEPVWEVMQSPSRIEGVSARAAKAIEAFVEMVQNWRSALGQTGGLDDLSHELSDVVQRVIDESGLAAHYARGGTEEDHDRVENLDELVSAAADFPGVISEFPGLIEDGDEDFEGDVQSLEAHLFGWLESISLVADSDQVDPTRGVLTLMSLHASKGLEFEEVVVAGCEESVLPHLRSIGDDDAIEEERRLLFVGMTRAKKNLTLTSAKSRPVRGFRERTMESQFLSEIPNELVERWEANETESADPFLQSGSPSSLRSSRGPSGRRLASLFPVGCLVEHEQFGVGRVEAIMPRPTGTTARIDFRYDGVKTIILEYAKLERLE
ncbi:MAG: UvrD-helicase domain-containing protein [Planctomycetota bacterium]|nr:UvrD-helicase domain-containing protein [Planctomycetota bacterium]